MEVLDCLIPHSEHIFCTISVRVTANVNGYHTGRYLLGTRSYSYMCYRLEGTSVAISDIPSPDIHNLLNQVTYSYSKCTCTQTFSIYASIGNQ